MKVICCTVPSCRRPFQLNSFVVSVNPHSRPGEIVCPHCGSVTAGEEGHIFITHALSGEDESTLQQRPD